MHLSQWRKSQEANIHSYIVSQIEGSLERLDLEYIDILLLHNTDNIRSQDQLTGLCWNLSFQTIDACGQNLHCYYLEYGYFFSG